MTAVCDGCGRTRQLANDGTVTRHRVYIPVSRSAVPSVGRGRVKPWCSGSGKAPRRVER
jgi:hypothetical protein